MKDRLIAALSTAVNALSQAGVISSEAAALPIQLEYSRHPEAGDFASNVALVLASHSHTQPLFLAAQLLEKLPKLPEVEKVSVAAPGFINFKLIPQVHQQIIPEILNQASSYGRSTEGKDQRVLIEIVSADPLGPLHIGHGRLAAYGGSLANILEAMGYAVHREYYVRDVGRQMRLLALSVWIRYLQVWGENIPLPRQGYQGDYLLPIAKSLKINYGKRFYHPAANILPSVPMDHEHDELQAENHIDALLTHAELLLGKDDFTVIFERSLKSILEDIHDDLQAFGVTCQTWFRESHLTYNGDIQCGIERLRQRGYLYEKEGATWFRATDFGDEKDRVVIRQNGQPSYFAEDIGYHFNKLERGFHLMLDVYGADHHGFKLKLAALLRALGENPEKVQVVLVQFAILYRGDTRVPMSMRENEFVALRELRQEVSDDAARFFYIMHRKEQHLDFDLELAKAHSNENPVYTIQYAHARICSVFRQLEKKGLSWDRPNGEQHLHLLQEQSEIALMRCLSHYPEVLTLSAHHREPCTLAHYLQELAHKLHVYYNAQPFLVEEAPLRDARFSLLAATQQVVINGLQLLGISAPEMM